MALQPLFIRGWKQLSAYFENMSKADIDTLKPRHICRYLKGSFVFFHKDSVYNKSVSKYRGEHDKMTIGDFHNAIVQYAKIIIRANYKNNVLNKLNSYYDNEIA